MVLAALAVRPLKWEAERGCNLDVLRCFIHDTPGGGPLNWAASAGALADYPHPGVNPHSIV